MAKSIKDFGEKVEKVIEKEEVKKESEALKEAIKTLPTEAKVRIIKIEDGVEKYIDTTLLSDFDKSDPYAWLKRRYAKKHGSGEYIIQFISSDGEVIKKSNPIYIEVEEEQSNGVNKKFFDIVNEALKIKEEALETKAKLHEDLSKLESEKAKSFVEIMEKQLDIITKIYDEKLSVIKEALEKKGDESSVLIQIMEIEKLKSEFREAINGIKETIERVVNQNGKQDETQVKYLELITNLMKDTIERIEKSHEKDGMKETLELVKTIKELFVDKKEEHKDPVKETLEILETVKNVFGLEKSKDLLTEILENPQKLELIKKLLGLEEVKELKSTILSMLDGMIRREPEQRKDILDEITDSVVKLKQLKEVLAPILGVQPQPAKSFIELISSLVSSPNMPEIVGRIMDGFVRAKLIEAGFIPADMADKVVYVPRQPVQALPQQRVEYGQVQPQVQRKQKKKQQVPKEEEMRRMVENFLKECLVEAAQQSQDMSSHIEFAHKLAEILYTRAKNNPVILGIVVATPHKKRIEISKKVLGEVLRDLPGDVLDDIVRETENKLKELIAG